jgi:hypothetical protein
MVGSRAPTLAAGEGRAPAPALRLFHAAFFIAASPPARIAAMLVA